MVVQAFNLSTGEAEAGESLSLKTVWSSTERSDLHRETLSKKQNNQKTTHTHNIKTHFS